MSEALELEIERAWVGLAKVYGKRTLFLTEAGKLRWGWVADRTNHGREVGTYTRAVSLEDLRADVFFIFETSRGRVHG
jgi:hypothetical protein